jgi:hypothetical protein
MKHSLVNTAKYLIFLIFCFTILKFIPTKQIGTIELLSMVVIISIGYFSIDLMTPINSDQKLDNIEQMTDLVDIDDNVDIDDLVDDVKKRSSSCEDCVNKVNIIKETFKNKLKDIEEETDKESIENKITKLETRLLDLVKENEQLKNSIKNKVDPQVDAVKSIVSESKNKKLRFNDTELSFIGSSDEKQPEKKQSNNKMTLKLINVYLNILKNEKVLTYDEMETLILKLDSELFTPDELLSKLELLMKKTNVKSSEVGYNDWMSQVGKDMLTPQQKRHIGENDSTMNNKWDNTYTLLNTDKWRLPVSKPPVCVSNDNCSVCPSTTSGYPINLKEWDNARYVTTSKKQSQI